MKCRFSLFIIALFTVSFAAQAQFQKINTFAGDGSQGFYGDGTVAPAAQFHGPISVSVDNLGNVYIVDFYNFRVRKVSSTGVISTIAGNGVNGDTGDGTIGTSAAVCPHGVVADKRGNVYISDASYSVIRKVNALGFISTYAGNKLAGWGYSGDGGAATAAKLQQPYGLALDAKGNLYIADAGNHCIRKVDTFGKISTFAGVGGMAGYTGDGGTATFATLDSPYAVAVDKYNNVIIADYGNNVIRMVDSTRMIQTIAGNGVSGISAGAHGYTGDNGPALSATLNNPKGVAVDTIGNVFIADADNNVIRKVDWSGIITTVVGDGTQGYGGDLGYSIGANLHNPYGLAVDNRGSIFIADANNQRVRISFNVNLGVNNLTNNKVPEIFPNPFTGSITINGLELNQTVCIYDMAGRQLTSMLSVKSSTNQAYDLSALATGVYSMHVFDAIGNRISVLKLVKE